MRWVIELPPENLDSSPCHLYAITECGFGISGGVRSYRVEKVNQRGPMYVAMRKPSSMLDKDFTVCLGITHALASNLSPTTPTSALSLGSGQLSY